MNASNPVSPAYRFLPFSRVSARTLIWAALTGMAITLPTIYLIQLLNLPLTPGQGAAADARATSIPVWMLALKALVIFPVIEECLYRGLILQCLRRYLPLWAALIPPNLLFGITHWGFSLQNAVFALLVGLYFSWLVIRTGSLLPAFLCHGAINLFAVFFMRPLFAGANAHPSTLLQPLPLLILAISLGVLAYGTRQLLGEPRRRPAAIPATA